MQSIEAAKRQSLPVLSLSFHNCMGEARSLLLDASIPPPQTLLDQGSPDQVLAAATPAAAMVIASCLTIRRANSCSCPLQSGMP